MTSEFRDKHFVQRMREPPVLGTAFSGSTLIYKAGFEAEL